MSDLNLSYRLMTIDDINRVPLDCQGSREDLLFRMRDLGSAAVLVFDGDDHVGQLQFRRHDSTLRSKEGIWSPDYWGDFGQKIDTLPRETLGIFCYHVGQLESGEERDPRYFGRGIGTALLDYLIAWAETGLFAAIVAKHTPPDRAVMGFMGGQPVQVYLDRGFECAASWIDEQLLKEVLERGIVPPNSQAEQISTVGACIKWLR